VWDETFDPFSNSSKFRNLLRRKLGEEAGNPLLQLCRGSGLISSATQAPRQKERHAKSGWKQKIHA